MKTKTHCNSRQHAIKELIKKHAIQDHATLLQLLETEYGIHTNQAVISRDLRNLGIFKRTRESNMVYELPEVDIVTEMLQYAVQSAQSNESLIVIKTIPGTSDFVGDFLDQQQDLPILGTIAGENTVLVVPRSIRDIPQLLSLLTMRLKLSTSTNTSIENY